MLRLRAFVRGLSLQIVRVIHPKGGLLRALLTYQAQNRTAIPIKSGDGGHTLSLTGVKDPNLDELDLGPWNGIC
jgi:hypothetical protein